MSKLNPPKELRFDGNLSQNWERWKKEFQFYMTATESNDKDEDVKTSRLLTAIGERAREIYYTFTFADAADAMKLEPVIAKFDEYMNPKKNIPYLRYKFFSYNQIEGQSIDDYVTELKLKSSHCEFGTLKASLIRDRIVAGVKEKKVQERLLREPELTLEKAIDICRAADETKKPSEEMQSKIPHNQIDPLRHRREKENQQYRGKQSDREKRETQRKDFRGCGSKHDKGNCPAFGKVCKNVKNAITLQKCASQRKLTK